MVRVVLLVLVGAVSAAGWLLHGAAKIGVGYSAKQLCSGVFVSHLPAEFVLEHDILPRMATVAGMDRFVRAEVGTGSATVKILTAGFRLLKQRINRRLDGSVIRADRACRHVRSGARIEHIDS